MPNRGPEEYLAMAQHAERAADASQSEIAKQSWRAIAESYRALAAERLRRMQAERPSKDSL